MKKSIFWGFSLIVLSLIMGTGVAKAKITLPSFISDGMVLQQNAKDPIWGWAAPGESISVTGSWNHHTYKTKANKYGKWKIKIKAPKAGGPFTLTIKGRQTVTLHNVMSGEVWLASGQSNMEMPVSGWPKYPLLHSKEVIKQAHYPDIHIFNVKRAIAITPQKDVQGSWSPVTPKSVASFSAAAYFFGLQLHKKLHVPIGVIASDWGGTVAEAWTSENGLRKLGDFDSTLDTLALMRPHMREVKTQYHENQITWKKRSKRIVQSYKKRNFDDSNWDEMQLPTDWEKAGYPNLDGIMWFRKTVQIPASWKGKTLTLSLGPIDDNDVTWFNGHKVGSTKGWTIKRSYTVPGRFVKTGENVIAVRVLDTGGNGGIYGKTKLLKLYPAHASTSDTIGLAGKWKYKIGAKKPHAQLISNPNTPTVLYNGMIAPLIPFHIRGVIWYQGESNVGRARQYSRLFPDMIKDWRNHWKEGKFPFYYVQIAPFPYGGNGKQGAALRDAQRRSLRVSNTGMVVTMDIGDTTLIHPANKEEVGRRLSLWAMAHVYGKQGLVDSGPLYKSMKVKGPEAVISFTHVDGGLVAKNGNLKEFEIAGSNGRFVPAQATIQGNKVVVHASDVHHPTAVRYGWKDTAQAYLFNKAGLPASSFTTENLTGQK